MIISTFMFSNRVMVRVRIMVINCFNIMIGITIRLRDDRVTKMFKLIVIIIIVFINPVQLHQ